MEMPPLYEHGPDLVLGEQLSDDEIDELLSPAGFADPCAAYRRLQRIADSPQVKEALTGVLPHLLGALGQVNGHTTIDDKGTFQVCLEWSRD